MKRRFPAACGWPVSRLYAGRRGPVSYTHLDVYKRQPLKRFFNTSGLLYKSLGLKEKLPQMSEAEQIALLATDGMLVKRPLIVGEDFVLVGFKPAEWERLI